MHKRVAGLRDTTPLPAAPRQIRLLGEDLIPFRDGRVWPVLVHRNCVHRGASPCLGEVAHRCIRCRNPGWLFNLRGLCLEQPCEPNLGEPPGWRSHQPWDPARVRCALVRAGLGRLARQGMKASHRVGYWANSGEGIVMLHRLLLQQDAVAAGQDRVGVRFDPEAPPGFFAAGAVRWRTQPAWIPALSTANNAPRALRCLTHRPSPAPLRFSAWRLRLLPEIRHASPQTYGPKPNFTCPEAWLAGHHRGASGWPGPGRLRWR